MSIVIGGLMVTLGLAGIIIAVTGTQDQVFNAITGHSATPITTTAASIPSSSTNGGTELV